MSKYGAIHKQLYERITRGELAGGERLPPEKALAGQFGVSYMTARRAVTELVRDGLVERRWGDGTYVRSVPVSPNGGHQVRSGAANGLRVALLSTETPGGDYRTRCLAAFESAISGYGGSTYLQTIRADEALSALCTHGTAPDAIFYIHSSVHSETPLEQCMRTAKPLVAACYYGVLNVNRVYEDWGWALQELMEHLIGIGHRRIAMAGFSLPGAEETAWIEARKRAFLATARRYGLLLDETDIYSYPLASQSHGDRHQFEAGMHLGKRLLQHARGYTAVIGLNDRVALGVMRIAKKAGVRVPEDLSIAGFDNIPEAAHAGLTSVRPAAERDGQAAAGLLVDMVRNPAPDTVHQLTSRPELMVRTTTGAPPVAHDDDDRTRCVVRNPAGREDLVCESS